VARYWEDVIWSVPAATEPVPLDLVDFISSHPADWVAQDSDEAEIAAIWHQQHGLDLGYLRHPPWIQWWRSIGDDDTMTIAWRHRRDSDIEFAAPEQGRVRVPTSSFITAVQELDGELLTAMQRRIDDLTAAGAPPGVDIDLRQVRNEQQDRATWLHAALRRPHETDWQAVRIGAQQLLPS
jgi:Family of unknown function (DUF5984)